MILVDKLSRIPVYEQIKNQIMEQKEDGSVYLKFSSNQRQQILSWVLGFGPSVTVLAPEGLKQDVMASVKAVAEKYK